MEAKQSLDLRETLANLIKSSSEYIENLPSDARKIVTDLQDIQDVLNELQYMYKLECLEIEKKYHELRKPLFRRIQDLVSGKPNTFNKTSEDQVTKASIPNFWPTTLSHHPSFHHLIAEHDHQALNHLVNINIEYLTDSSSTSGLGYRIHFEFSPNDFFEDKILTKTYLYGTVVGQSGDFVYHSANGTDIRWKNRIDFTKRPNGGRRASFFELFYPPTFATEEDMIQLDYDDIEDPAETLERIELDYCLGADLKDQILPSVVDWFTGKFLQEYSYIGEDIDIEEPTEVIPRDPKGSRLLAWALEQEATEKNGSNGPTTDDIDGFSPLYLAARLGHVGAVKLLLKREHPDIGWRDKEGRTPFYMAAREGHDAVVKIFVVVDGVDLNARMVYGWTPLSAAADHGHDACLKVLVAQKGVDLNLQNNAGFTALFAAARNGHYDAVKVLLSQNGIELNVQLSDGATPLYVACQNGHVDVVKALVAQAGTNINIQRNGGFTPLYIAASKGHEAPVQVLLDQPGIDVNLGEDGGWTPLHIAVKSGHEGAVKALLGHPRINVNMRLKQGHTPLAIAKGDQLEAIVTILQNSGGEV